MNINITVSLTLPQDAEKFKILSGVLAGGPIPATIVEVPSSAPAPEKSAAKVRKQRVDKDVSSVQAPAPAPAPTVDEQPAAKPAAAPGEVFGRPAEMSEEESKAEIKAVAKVYIARFANQMDGIKAFRGLMSSTCGVGKLDDLVHAQRLQVIVAAKAELAKADTAKSAAPAAASGVEV
jgi:hypothetical protein